MNGWENSDYVTMIVISNIAAILLLLAAWKLPRISRLLFFMLFTWAGCVNWFTVLHSPSDYLEYGNLAVFEFYTNFINGWFKSHLLVAVGFVATSQLLIAIGMLLKGTAFKVAAMGAIVFLLAIAPLGIGAGFPCTLIMALAMYILLRQSEISLPWHIGKQATLQRGLIEKTEAA